MATEWSSPLTKCYDSHPGLPVGEYVVYGGSASTPVVKDADIYVSLQAGSTCGLISDPWDDRHVVEIQFAITDMRAPRAYETKRFLRMVDWLCNQLHQGKKIHVGCIGGHGRTGMVLAALVAADQGRKDAIQYVRKHYCHRAVESEEQISFLMKHYGITHAQPSKKPVEISSPFGSRYLDDDRRLGFVKPSQKALFREPERFPVVKKEQTTQPIRIDSSKAVATFVPVNKLRSIWRETRIDS